MARDRDIARARACDDASGRTMTEGGTSEATGARASTSADARSAREGSGTRVAWMSARDRAIDDELEARERRGTGSAEVYCVSRPFQEWGRGIFSALPRGAREALLTAGVAHFMLVYKDLKTGEMQQFDFGPVGGDVHDRWLALAGGKTYRSSEQGARDTVYAMTRGRVGKHRARRKSSCVRGEIRQTKLQKLPEGAYLVGSTHMTLDDIHGFNQARDAVYELHVNDCRHYLNDLSFYLTRESAVCSKYVNHSIMRRLEEKKGQFWEHHMWLTKAMTDVEYLPHWNKAGRFAGATLMFGTVTRFVPFLPAKRLVTWGSGVAAGTSENVPVVREVLNFGGFLVDSCRSALSWTINRQNDIRKQITQGVEAQFLNARRKLSIPRAARLARSDSFEDLSSPRVGIRVKASSLSLPTVATSAGMSMHKTLPAITRKSFQALTLPIRGFVDTLRRINNQKIEVSA